MSQSNTTQFTNVKPVDLKYLQPIYPSPTLTAADYSSKIDERISNLSKYLTSLLDPNEALVYNNCNLNPNEFQEDLAALLANPLLRVPDTKFWDHFFSAILSNPKNPETWLNQLQISQLISQNLPWPDPINAIYEFKGDVQAALKQVIDSGNYQITDFFSANFYAYLMQFLPTGILKIAVLPDKASVSRLWSSLKASGVPNIDEMIKYSSHNLLSIFKMTPNPDLQSGYRLLMEGLKPYSLQPTLGTLFSSTYFLITDAESLMDASEDDMRVAIQQTSNQFNSILKFSLIPTSKLETLPHMAQEANKTHVKPGDQSDDIDKDLQQLANNFTVPRKLGNPLKTVKAIQAIMDNFITDHETAYKSTHTKHSFLTANRRHPDDINMPGKRKFYKYKPNIMIHLDTSGSVTEEEYKEALVSILFVAKKLNIPIYFQTFSHYITDIAYLDLRKYSVSQAYAILQRVPKASGGTEYEGVWKTIRQTPKDFVHFMITDFEYDLSSYMKFNPREKDCTNTYYIGFKDSYSEYVNDFAHQMFRAGDYSIFSHILY